MDIASLARSVLACTIQAPALVAGALLVGACASTELPRGAVAITTPRQADSPAVTVTDKRALERTLARADSDLPAVYLSDDAFEPTPASMVNRFVSSKMPHGSSPLRVDLIRFDVALSNSEVRDIYRTAPPAFLIVDAPVGANVVGNLVGMLLFAAFQGQAPDKSVHVKIEIGLPTGPVEIADYGMLYSGRSITEAIQTVLPRALDSLANRAVEASQAKQ